MTIVHPPTFDTCSEQAGDSPVTFTGVGITTTPAEA